MNKLKNSIAGYTLFEILSVLAFVTFAIVLMAAFVCIFIAGDHFLMKYW